MGNAHHTAFSPKNDSPQETGINKNSCLSNDRNTLSFPLPMAWKKVGIISDGAIGTKLIAITLRAYVPVSLYQAHS